MPKVEISEDAILRFLDCVDMTGSCWLWTRSPNKDGYGNFKVGKKTFLAHRFAHLVEFGFLDDRCVCHSCDVPLCVNPAHFWLGSNAENQADKARKGRVAGDKNPRAKVTNRQMQEIRQRYAGGEAVKELAKEFGYSRSHLYKALRGDQWKVPE